MAYIKKVVIQGFKSFAKRTEIPFDKGVNVVIGPNGSGKSNISDAICFVLGRLSVKSMPCDDHVGSSLGYRVPLQDDDSDEQHG